MVVPEKVAYDIDVPCPKCRLIRLARVCYLVRSPWIITGACLTCAAQWSWRARRPKRKD